MGSWEGNKRVAQEGLSDTAKIAAKFSIPSCSLLAFLQPGIWLGGGGLGWGGLVKVSLFEVVLLKLHACFHWKDPPLISGQEVRLHANQLGSFFLNDLLYLYFWKSVAYMKMGMKPSAENSALFKPLVLVLQAKVSC